MGVELRWAPGLIVMVVGVLPLVRVQMQQRHRSAARQLVAGLWQVPSAAHCLLALVGAAQLQLVACSPAPDSHRPARLVGWQQVIGQSVAHRYKITLTHRPAEADELGFQRQ